MTKYASVSPLPTLADFPFERIYVECSTCGRRGFYNVEKLKEEHGPGARLFDLRRVIAATCPAMQGPNGDDKCKVGYPELIGVHSGSPFTLDPLHKLKSLEASQWQGK